MIAKLNCFHPIESMLLTQIFQKNTLECTETEDTAPINLPIANEIKKVKTKKEILSFTKYLKLLVMNTVLQCEFCEFEFSDQNSLFLHEAAHDPEMAFECRYCVIYVRRIKDIKVHWSSECNRNKRINYSNVNLMKLYVCNVCDERFDSLDSLCEHR